MTNVMLDIETLGTKPGSVILSVGAVVFDEAFVGKETFHLIANTQTCIDAGLTIDDETLGWWERQSPTARQVLDAAENKNSMSIGELLCHFGIWLQNIEKDRKNLYVWGNGAAFDNVLIAEALRRCGLKPAWNYYNDRCYRTLKNLRPDIKLIRLGTHHDALDDARSQADHAIRLMSGLREQSTSLNQTPTSAMSLINSDIAQLSHKL